MATCRGWATRIELEESLEEEDGAPSAFSKKAHGLREIHWEITGRPLELGSFTPMYEQCNI